MSDPTLTGSGIEWSSQTQTGYCSQADLEKKIGQQTLAELTNDVYTQGVSNEGVLPDPTVVQTLIDEADQDIDSIVGMRYTVPFITVPNSIKFLSINMSCYHAFRRKLGANKITEDWQKIYDDSVCELAKIASGEQEIGVTPAYPASATVNLTSSPTVEFFNTLYPMSKY